MNFLSRILRQGALPPAKKLSAKTSDALVTTDMVFYTNTDHTLQNFPGSYGVHETYADCVLHNFEHTIRRNINPLMIAEFHPYHDPKVFYEKVGVCLEAGMNPSQMVKHLYGEKYDVKPEAERSIMKIRRVRSPQIEILDADASDAAARVSEKYAYLFESVEEQNSRTKNVGEAARLRSFGSHHWDLFVRDLTNDVLGFELSNVAQGSFAQQAETTRQMRHMIAARLNDEHFLRPNKSTAKMLMEKLQAVPLEQRARIWLDAASIRPIIVGFATQNIPQGGRGPLDAVRMNGRVFIRTELLRIEPEPIAQFTILPTTQPLVDKASRLTLPTPQDAPVASDPAITNGPKGLGR